MSTKRLPEIGLFVTGTDTEVGKTFVTAAVAAAIRQSGHVPGVYKPVATGAQLCDGRLVSDDALALAQAAGYTGPIDDVCPQRFYAPAAPPVAAAAQGESVDRFLLRTGAGPWSGRCEILLVEGVGGLLCPLTDDETVADLAAEFGYPLLIVARRGLGTLNHTLLTVEVAENRGLQVAGVILNASHPLSGSLAEQTNADILRARLHCPLLAELPYFLPTQQRESVEYSHPAVQHLCPIDWIAMARSGAAPPRSGTAHT